MASDERNDRTSIVSGGSEEVVGEVEMISPKPLPIYYQIVFPSPVNFQSSTYKLSGPETGDTELSD